MKVSQIIQVVIITAVLSAFVGMMLQNHVKDPVMRIVVFGLTMLSWVFLVVSIDLYSKVQQQQEDMATYMKCN